MTNSGNSPEPPKQGFKITLMQGVIGAVSLAGTTAIPLVVQRVLTPPTSTSPAQIQPAQILPAATSPQDPSTLKTPQTDSPGKGKKKAKKRD